MGKAGKVLKQVLEDYDISQTQLASELNIGRSNVYRWVNGVGDPNSATVNVWIVDPRAKTVTIFQPKAVPITYRGNTAISEPQLPELEISAQIIFEQAGLAG